MKGVCEHCGKKRSFYCENCFEEDLKHYIKDRFGCIFCSKECLIESSEYRDVEDIEKDIEIVEVE